MLTYTEVITRSGSDAAFVGNDTFVGNDAFVGNDSVVGTLSTPFTGKMSRTSTSTHANANRPLAMITKPLLTGSLHVETGWTPLSAALPFNSTVDFPNVPVNMPPVDFPNRKTASVLEFTPSFLYTFFK